MQKLNCMKKLSFSNPNFPSRCSKTWAPRPPLPSLSSHPAWLCCCCQLVIITAVTLTRGLSCYQPGKVLSCYIIRTVCVCVCMCVCVYALVCVWVCVDVCMCLCVSMCMFFYVSLCCVVLFDYVIRAGRDQDTNSSVFLILLPTVINK